jgi:hypothetical protein
VRTVELVTARLNPDLRIVGVLPDEYNGRHNLSLDVLAEVTKRSTRSVSSWAGNRLAR